MLRVAEGFMYTITSSQGTDGSGIRDYLVLSTDLLTVYIFLPERFESAGSTGHAPSSGQDSIKPDAAHLDC